MKYLKVDGHPHLIRNTETNDIINTNQTEYQEYILRKKLKKEEKKKVNTIENEVEDIKKDLEEIKLLLRSLLNES